MSENNDNTVRHATDQTAFASNNSNLIRVMWDKSQLLEQEIKRQIEHHNGRIAALTDALRAIYDRRETVKESLVDWTAVEKAAREVLLEDA